MASQLDQIDRDIAAAIARKSQITKEYQRVRGKIEDLQGKIAELEKSEANYPYQMQGADLEVDACRKRRSDLLDESDTWLETFHKSHEKKEALKLFDAHQEKRRR